MRFWVGVTDNSWFSFLRASNAEEVNFWKPSARNAFAAVEPGAPFLFKLRRPNNHIAGGGIFIRFSVLPLSMAWETFGSKNGAPTRQAFEALIRPLTPDPNARDPEIGCAVLTETFFWPDDAWIPNPPGWSSNIVTGRSYDSLAEDGKALWSQVVGRIQELPLAHQSAEERARYGAPTLVKPRLGQGAFRVLVTEAYQRHCALTGESTLPVLEAAHIVPYANEGPHEVSNGLLLRSDFHKLFDLGYVTVDTNYKIKVSPRIHDEWFNGKAYYRLDGQPLRYLPNEAEQQPRKEFLDWHNKMVYQA